MRNGSCQAQARLLRLYARQASKSTGSCPGLCPMAAAAQKTIDSIYEFATESENHIANCVWLAVPDGS